MSMCPLTRTHNFTPSSKIKSLREDTYSKRKLRSILLSLVLKWSPVSLAPLSLRMAYRQESWLLDKTMECLEFSMLIPLKVSIVSKFLTVKLIQ